MSNTWMLRDCNLVAKSLTKDARAEIASLDNPVKWEIEDDESEFVLHTESSMFPALGDPMEEQLQTLQRHGVRGTMTLYDVDAGGFDGWTLTNDGTEHQFYEMGLEEIKCPAKESGYRLYEISTEYETIMILNRYPLCEFQYQKERCSYLSPGRGEGFIIVIAKEDEFTPVPDSDSPFFDRNISFDPDDRVVIITGELGEGYKRCVETNLKQWTKVLAEYQ